MPIITTFAGSGVERLQVGEAVGPTRLRHPSGVTVTRDGGLAIADSNENAVVVVDVDGVVTSIAGGNGPGYSGDGGPASEAQFFMPTMVVIDVDGSLLVADRDNHAIRRIQPDGTITTVAGGNGEGNSGDGGPARAALLNRPRGLALDPSGALFLTDRDNHTIRRIDADGTISTVVAGGFGYSGDGRPARKARMRRPRGLTFDRDGVLHIADRNNHAIRRIDQRGRITTVIGGNGAGYSGDGGDARKARLDHPSGVVFDDLGNTYVSDHLNHAIRRVDADGVITTVVGGNGAGYSGDGGEALDACIDYPSGLDLDPAGNLYIADRNNDVVRVVHGLAVAGVAGRADEDRSSGENRSSGEPGPGPDRPWWRRALTSGRGAA